MKSIRQTLGLSLLLGLAFLAGYVFRAEDGVGAQQDTTPSATPISFPLLQEAITFVESHYVKDQPPPEAVEYDLIRAYLGGLGDPNTFFIEPAVAASESDTLAGRYGGIGVDVRRDESGQFVLYPFPEGSAAEVGIIDGDILLMIDTQPVEGSLSLDDVRQALRGELVEGGGVAVEVRNTLEAEGSDSRRYFVPFAEVLVPSVTWRPLLETPEVGYINISRFTSRTPEEFREGVRELQAAEVQALVLDLRNNPGGLLAESVVIAGEFFDGGTLSIEERITGEETKQDDAGGVILDLPTVVLVNRGTASAAEIVAGALQARERAILIGQQTFGKGSIQSIFGLSDSSSIHVTVALWYTPDREPLDGVGLTPDITMIPDDSGRDIELGEALRYIGEAGWLEATPN